MKKLNIVGKIIKFPFVVMMLPVWIPLWFILTDWEKEESRSDFKKMFKASIW